MRTEKTQLEKAGLLFDAARESDENRADLLEMLEAMSDELMTCDFDSDGEDNQS